MSETETQKQSQDSLERLSKKMKLLSEYQSKLNQAKTSLEKYQSLQHETTPEKIKSTIKEQHQSENIQVEIVDVKLLKPVSSLLHGCYLDRPKQGEIFHQHTIKLAGWVVSKNAPAVEVEIINNGQVIKTASINKKRPGVAKAYPQVARAKTSGFATEIQLISLPQESELTLQVILKDRSRIPLGSLKLHSKYQKSIGVIYIATGEKFVREACQSVDSLKAQMPNIPVTIFASQDIKNSNFERVVAIEKPDYNYTDKVKYMGASPYDYTLFIDTDTYISADFSEIFTLLDKFDMGVAHAPLNIRGFVNGVPESFQQLNTGVILYKKSPQVEHFFAKWLELYNPRNNDQTTFREALYNSKLRIATLAPEYNCRFPFPGVVFGTVKILHGRHKNLPLVAQKINSGKGLRVINPEEFKHLEKKKSHNQSSQVSNVSLDSEVEIISVHVPKTAGTTFRDLLIQVYGKEKVFNDYKKQQVSEVLLEIKSQNIKVIHGHFQVQKYKDYFLDAKRIIWLREPIRRLISNYWHQVTYFQNIKITQNEIELEKKKFLNWANRPEIRNFLSSYFIEKNIEDFWFVGITEFLEEDLKELQIMLGWQQLEITYQNQHKYSKVYQYLVKTFLSDGELIEEIKFINSKDIKLYEMALTLREKRIKTRINRVIGGTIPETRTMAFTAAHNGNEVEDLTIQGFIPKLKTAEVTTIDSNTTENSDEIIDQSLGINQLREAVERDNLNKKREKCELSICAIMKDEALHLEEWLEFHKLVGVERFYLYNNNSTDNTLDIVSPYIENSEVVLENWHFKNRQQKKAYNHFLQNYKNESKWIAFIDLDEFLFPTEKNDLREILEEFSDVPAVGVNWLIFGTSGHEKKPEGFQIENFTKRAKEDFKANLHFKSIVRSEFTIKCHSPHRFVYVNDGLAVNENYKELSAKASPEHSVKKLRINHYFTRSMEEALNKIKRGRTDVNKKIKIGDIKYHNRNDVEDLTIQRFIPQLKAALKTAEVTNIDSNTTDNSDEIIDQSLEVSQLKEEVESDYLNKQGEKYKLSICAIMKDEGPYLEEWLEFHKLVGVEKFYLYDNNSTDNTQNILQFYIQNREVIYYYWPDKPGQMSAYTHCLNNHKYDSEWIAFIDLDEFLFPTVADKITDIIDEFSDVSALGVNWLNFGTSGHEKKPEGLQIENFIKRAQTSFGPNKHVKCILRPDKTIRPLNPHQFVFSQGKVVTENKQAINKPFSSKHSIKKIRINHYTTRSKEESMKKMMRGRATKNEQRPWSHFESKDVIFNEVEDLTIHRYIPQLKKSLAAVAKEKSKVKFSLEKSNSLLTIGNLGKVVIENQHLKLTGWIVSLNFIPISSFKVWIGGEEYRDFKQTLGMESPRIKKERPRLKGAEKARFCLEIPLNKIHRENYQDLLIILTPMLGNFEGSVLIDVFNPSWKVPTEKYISQIDRNNSVNFQFNTFKWLGYLIQRISLKPTDSILDIGCGMGDISYGLAYYLTPKARYEGIEFSEKVIDWAKQEITSRKPNFNFQWHNIYHPFYNSQGTVPMREFIFPYAEASFDVICIHNLFYHLYSIDIRHYLDQIQRILKVGGKCLFACFLINYESQKLIADCKSSQHLVNEIEGGFCLDSELPEKTIGFQESLLIDWIKESGLTVVGKYYGSWCGRKSFTNPDLLVLQKKTEVQSKFNNYQKVLKQYKLKLQKIQGELGK